VGENFGTPLPPHVLTPTNFLFFLYIFMFAFLLAIYNILCYGAKIFGKNFKKGEGLWVGYNS